MTTSAHIFKLRFFQMSFACFKFNVESGNYYISHTMYDDIRSIKSFVILMAHLPHEIFTNLPLNFISKSVKCISHPQLFAMYI